MRLNETVDAETEKLDIREDGKIFFFNDTATTEIYTLSLHDALPIFQRVEDRGGARGEPAHRAVRVALHEEDGVVVGDRLDRKSTRLNSSHANISYAVFCLKKR